MPSSNSASLNSFWHPIPQTKPLSWALQSLTVLGLLVVVALSLNCEPPELVITHTFHSPFSLCW